MALLVVRSEDTLATSPNGVTWTPRTATGLASGIGGGIAWSPSNGITVLVDGSGQVFTSTDGIAWTARAGIGFATGYRSLLTYLPSLGKFVAGGASNGKMATSVDGVTWTVTTPFGTSTLSGMAYSPSLGKYVAVCSDGLTCYSSDAVTWTATTVALPNGVAVVWAPSLGLFAIASMNGSYQGYLYTSPDGMTWTLRLSGTSFYTPGALVWSPLRSLFVVSSYDSNGSSPYSNNIYSSPDGITWTARGGSNPLGTDINFGVNGVWSSGLGLFCLASATSGYYGYSVTSPDGITWTKHNITSNKWPYSVGVIQENVAPNAPTLNSPATGSTVDRGITQRFAWTFSDPDYGDSQSKFDLRYRTGAGAWTTITGTTPNSFWDAASATFTAALWEWQVRCYDALGAQGPWSPSSFFTAADAPGVPSITAPTSGSTIALASATVTWSAPSQTDYRIRRVADIAGAADTSTIYWDSGDVVDATIRSVTVAFPTNSRWEHVQVQLKDAGVWSSWADCRVDVSFTPPMVPTISLTPNHATASIDVAITNPTPTGSAPPTSYNDVYVLSTVDPEVRWATGVAPNGTWVFREPAAGRLYNIRVVAVGTNGTTATSV